MTKERKKAGPGEKEGSALGALVGVVNGPGELPPWVVPRSMHMGRPKAMSGELAFNKPQLWMSITPVSGGGCPRTHQTAAPRTGPTRPTAVRAQPTRPS